MKSLKVLVLILTILLFVFSCAKQSTPTGGPKDSIPPILVKSIPAQRQLNFKSNNIELTFSEFIALNNPKEQIIITPTIGKNYKISAKKKTVILELDTNLADSTTYTVNFRESIQDLTEKNPARNLHLAFSTGTYIDSLRIDGKVIDILTGKEVKDATIALYQPDTFNIFKHKPSYITKSNDKGVYKLENLKAGKYYIYAFDDKNKNLIADSKSEAYGFLTIPLELKQDIKNIIIPIQRLDARVLKITSARPYSNYFNVKVSKNLKDFSTASDSLKIFSSFGEDAANVKVYNTFGSTDSLLISFTASDSIGNKIDSSLYVKFNTRKTDKEKLSTALEQNTIIAATGQLKAILKFNKPINQLNYDSMLFSYDSGSVVNLTENDLEWNKTLDRLEIKKALNKQYFVKEKQIQSKQPKSPDPKAPANTLEKNKLILATGSFISVESDSSQNIKETSKILREEETAVLLVTIKTQEQKYILQLLDKNYKIIDTVKDLKEIKFSSLPPSAYILRLTIDKNGNGIWDQGNFLNKEEPEPVTFYKTEKGDQIINLKANWEVGPLLITY